MEFKKYEEYEYRNPLIGSTFIENGMSIIKDIKAFLSKYIDLSKHVKVVKALDVNEALRRDVKKH